MDTTSEQQEQPTISEAGNTHVINNASSMNINSPSIEHSDESTIDSFELSIIQENLVSSTPKSFSPKPKLIRLVNELSDQPLGVDLLQSLPIVSYIYPSSPLRGLLFAGDVILELDGKKSTEMNFHNLNGWLASNNSNVVDKTPRSILFLPGKRSPYNPGSSDYTPNRVEWHGTVDGKALVVDERCATDVLTERSGSQKQTAPHGKTDKSVTQSNSVCTVYLDEEVDNKSQESLPYNRVHQPTTPSLAQTLEEFVQGDKNSKDKNGLDTTTTTHSSSVDDSGSNQQLGNNDSSNLVRNFEEDQPPADILPHVQSSPGSSNIINYPSSPLVLSDTHSPQSSVSFSGEFGNDSTMPNLPLSPISRQTDEKNQSHDDTEKSHNAEVLEILKYTLRRSSSREFEGLCQSVLEKYDAEGSKVQSDDLSHNGKNVEETVTAKETATVEALPPSILKKTRKDTKKGKCKHKSRNRPPPTFDTITIEQDWEEDVSTIYGGKYNPTLHASNASVEDHIFECIETGCDPNTLSQLKLHGIEEHNQFQSEDQAGKVVFDNEDYQMKQIQLKLMKRRHRMIEGIFGVFIVVAIVVMIGVLVVIMKGR